MPKSREEIALELTISKLDCLQFTSYRDSDVSKNANFNKKLGEEIANIYNAVYNNLDCYKNTETKDDFSNDDDTLYV